MKRFLGVVLSISVILQDPKSSPEAEQKASPLAWWDVDAFLHWTCGTHAYPWLLSEEVSRQKFYGRSSFCGYLSSSKLIFHLHCDLWQHKSCWHSEPQSKKGTLSVGTLFSQKPLILLHAFMPEQKKMVEEVSWLPQHIPLLKYQKIPPLEKWVPLG